jgi:Thiolase, C-terminal domain
LDTPQGALGIQGDSDCGLAAAIARCKVLNPDVIEWVRGAGKHADTIAFVNDPPESLPAAAQLGINIVLLTDIAQLRTELIPCVDWTAAGCEPATMGLGPVEAVQKLFKRTGLSFDDIALVEPSPRRYSQCWRHGIGTTRSASMSTVRASHWTTPSAQPACTS